MDGVMHGKKAPEKCVDKCKNLSGCHFEGGGLEQCVLAVSPCSYVPSDPQEMIQVRDF